MTLSMRRWWRSAWENAVFSQVSTISSASISPVTPAPIAIMLVSLCSRVRRADITSDSSAQRMPLTLLAVMDTPMPVVQTTMPRSHSPEATALAAGPAKSG